MPVPAPSTDQPLDDETDRRAAGSPAAARAAGDAGPWGPFVRHGLEMAAAMMLGMGLLYGPLRAIVPGLAAYVALDALAMATLMAVPMAAWMGHRRHAPARVIEMAAVMAVPAFVLVALYWVDVIGGDAVRPAQHGLMIPAMLAVMLRRREDYADDAVSSEAGRGR